MSHNAMPKRNGGAAHSCKRLKQIVDGRETAQGKQQNNNQIFERTLCAV